MADQFEELDLLLGVEHRTVGLCCTKPITTKQQSVFWLVSQSRRMSAIFVGTCRWISLAAAIGDPVVSIISRQWTRCPLTATSEGQFNINRQVSGNHRTGQSDRSVDQSLYYGQHGQHTQFCRI